MSRKPLEFISGDFTLTRLEKELHNLKEEFSKREEDLSKEYVAKKKAAWGLIFSRLKELNKLPKDINEEDTQLTISDGVIFLVENEGEDNGFSSFMKKFFT